MVRKRKEQMARAMLSGVEIPVEDLAAIFKLEHQLANHERFERLNEMTRQAKGPSKLERLEREIEVERRRADRLERQLERERERAGS